jgi:hypothetical protein
VPRAKPTPANGQSVRYQNSATHKDALAPTTPPRCQSRKTKVFGCIPIGPWSSPQTIDELPEMKRNHPDDDKDTFCYAVKEQIEFTDTKLALTYACNSRVLAKIIASMVSIVQE